MAFHKLETEFPELFIVKPDVFGDARGFFMELHNAEAFHKIGLGHLQFVQDNLSKSIKGTLRGLHFQAPPHAQGKLVTVLEGRVLDVAVDIRKGSPTYGKAFVHEINDQNREMVFVPEGFAHGFQVLSDFCLFHYKCTDSYHKASEGGLTWNDPALAIAWHDLEPIVSDKDTQHPLLADFESPFSYQADPTINLHP
ncbi:MAG: dTDP-4-dehydrorhamnose 3,5-epimerase [Bacteroidota bacterium]